MSDEKPVRPDHVAIYIRWSTEDQSEGTTLAVQREGCGHYILSQGWQVNEDLIFIDDGYSGGTLDRPAMTKLRRLIQTEETDCVVVFKLDRLSRSVIDTVNLVLREWDGICYVKSAREPVDTSTPAGKMFFYMLASYAEWERNVIRDRLQSGKLRRAAEGKHLTVPPFGYMLVRRTEGKGHDRVVVPEQTEAVKQVFAMCEQGASDLQIAHWLNRHGYRTTRGGVWKPLTVASMLANPHYTGRNVYGRVRRNPRHKTNPKEPYYLPNDNPVTAEKGLPRIIEPEQFDRVQALKKSRHTGVSYNGEKLPGFNRAVSSRHLLTGLLRTTCTNSLGTRYTMHANLRRGGRYVYRCFGYIGSEPHRCGAYVTTTDLDAIVVTEFLRRYSDPALRERLVRDLIDKETGVNRVQLESEKFSLQQRLKDCERKLKRYTDDYNGGELDARRYSLLAEQVEKEQQETATRLRDVEVGLQTLQGADARKQALLKQLEAVDEWDSLSVPERKSLLRCVVDEITVSKVDGKVDVRIRWLGE